MWDQRDGNRRDLEEGWGRRAGRTEGRGWGLEEGPGQDRRRRRKKKPPGRRGRGAGRGGRYKAGAAGSLGSFIAHGMAGGGGSERARPGGLLPPVCRQPRRRVSAGGAGRGAGWVGGRFPAALTPSPVAGEPGAAVGVQQAVLRRRGGPLPDHGLRHRLLPPDLPPGRGAGTAGTGAGGDGAPGAALPGKRALPVRPAVGCVVAVLRGCRSEGCGFPPGPVWPLRCPGTRNGLMMSVGRDTVSVSYEHVPGGCEMGKKKRPWGTSCWQWGGVWGGLL